MRHKSDQLPTPWTGVGAGSAARLLSPIGGEGPGSSGGRPEVAVSDQRTRTLPERPSVGIERRSWLIRTTALAAITVFVLLGLSSQLGIKTSRAAARASGGLRAEVTYASRARPGLAVPFSVTVTRPGGFEHQIDVTTSTAYLAVFDENGISPDPASGTTDGSTTTWTFDPPEGDTLTVWFDARIEPGVQWRQRGTTTVTTGPESVTVRYTTWILP